jgi:t-SNARE complex subunit (syntaxin)
MRTNDPFFVKESSSGALLNTNKAGFNAYKQTRTARLKEKQTQEARLKAVEAGMDEIKQLLLKVLEGQQKG